MNIFISHEVPIEILAFSKIDRACCRPGSVVHVLRQERFSVRRGPQCAGRS